MNTRPDDWEQITDFLPPAEADAKFVAWREEREAEGVVLRDEDIRQDIGRGVDGSTVYRYSYRRPSRDIED